MTWVLKANLKGPAGQDATDAAADDAAVAGFVNGSGPTATAVDARAQAVATQTVADLFGIDPDTHAYNVKASNLAKWRAALVAAAGGGAQARITVLGDSNTQGLWSGFPFLTASWPGRLQRHLAKYGYAGTGIVTPWTQLVETGQDPYQPALTFTGSVTDHGWYGVCQQGARQVTKTDDTSHIQFRAYCDTFRVFLLSTAGPARVYVDGVDVGTVKGHASDPAQTFPTLPGYAATVSPASGLLVSDIPAGGLGWHTLKILPAGANGDMITVVGFEGLVTSGGGVVVSNMGLSGAQSAQLTVDDDAQGYYGMSLGIDTPRGHLNIIQISINDYQTHVPVATFKTRIRTAIQRAKTATPVTNGGTTSNGDVLLVAGQPVNEAEIPADGIKVPAYSLYTAALYELADDEDVPLIDLNGVFTDFATGNANGWYADNIHPSPLGGEKIAAAIARVIDVL